MNREISQVLLLSDEGNNFVLHSFITWTHDVDFGHAKIKV